MNFENIFAVAGKVVCVTGGGGGIGRGIAAGFVADWHFASAVRHDDLIFFSGVVGWGNSPEDEFKNAWASLGVTLAEAGVGCEDIIDTTIYMVDLPRLRHAKSNLIAQKESGL